MGKAISKDLYHLIQALGKTEKRNFKLFAEAGTPGSALYIELFNAIDQQKQYDESRLLKRVKNLHPSQLSNQKNYLYKQIIKSARFFKNDTTASSEIEDMIFRIQFLYSKGLFDQCRKYLKRAKKLAEAKERFHTLLEVLQWERHLSQQEPYSEKRSIKLNEIYADELNALEKHKNIIDFQALSANFNNLLHIRGLKDPQARKEIEAIIKMPLLSDEKQALSDHAKFFFYNINAVYYFITGNLEKSYKFFRSNVRLMRSSEERKKENVVGYISVLNNYASICSSLKKYHELEGVINDLKALLEDTSVKLTEKMEMGIFIRAYGQELIWYNNTGACDKAQQVVKNIEEGLEKYKGKVEAKHLVMIHYHVFLYYFLTGSFDKGQKWLNSVLSETKSHTFLELHKVALILNIINQLELGNRDLIGYFITSIHREQQKEKIFSPFEIKLIDDIRKINKIGYDPDRRKKFNTLFESYKKQEKIYKNEALSRYFELLHWFRAKAENRIFAEVIAENNNV